MNFFDTVRIDTVPRVPRWLTVVAVLTAVSLATVDLTVVNVAYDTIMGALGATLDEISWISTAYVLGGLAVLPMTGWLHQFFGHRTQFLGAIAVFTTGSVLCALSTDVVQLSLARALQGIGGGLLQPTGQAILFATFPAEGRSRAQTLYGYGIMLGPLVGPLIGGVLLNVTSWPAIFAINVPIGIFAFALVLVAVRDEKRAERPAFQPFALIAMVVGLVALQDVLQRAERLGWFDSLEIVAATALAVVALATFVGIEVASARPMVDLRLLRLRSFTLANASVFLIALAVTGVSFIITGFCQDVLRYDPLTTALVLVPSVFSTVAAMALAGPLTRRTSPYLTLPLGLAIMAAAIWWLSDLRYESAFAEVAAARALQGFGNGLMFVPLGLINVADVPAARLPSATGLMALVRQIAGAFAIAILTSTLEHHRVVDEARIIERMNTNAPPVAALTRRHGVHGRSLAPGLLRGTVHAATEESAYAATFRYAAIGTAFATMFAAATYRRRRRSLQFADGLD